MSTPIHHPRYTKNRAGSASTGTTSIRVAVREYFRLKDALFGGLMVRPLSEIAVEHYERYMAAETALRAMGVKS